MKPKVSVLLPVYNGQNTILNAVSSILNQTFTDFELLIIDDGSTDQTSRLLATIQDRRVKVFQVKKNGGIARALNFGIKLTQTSFIARMDADDYSAPDRLEKQYTYLIKHPACGVVSSLVTHLGSKSQEGYAHYVSEINKIITTRDIYNKRFQESPIAHPSVMFKKELVGQFGGYNEAELPEDYEFWLRLMYNGVEIHKVPYNSLIWNDLPNRISRNNQAYSDQKFYTLKAKYLAKHFMKLQGHLPNLWIWGTGRTVNKNVKPLLAEGFQIEKYINVKPTQASNQVYYEDVPTPGSQIILSYVRDRKGKIEILRFMKARGYEEGTNFFMLS